MCWANILAASCCAPLRQQNSSSSFSSSPHPPRWGFSGIQSHFPLKKPESSFPLSRRTDLVSLSVDTTCSPSGPLSQFSEHQALSHTCPGAEGSQGPREDGSREATSGTVGEWGGDGRRSTLIWQEGQLLPRDVSENHIDKIAIG